MPHQLRQRAAERLIGGLVAVDRQPLAGQARAARKLDVSLELFGYPAGGQARRVGLPKPGRGGAACAQRRPCKRRGIRRLRPGPAAAGDHLAQTTAHQVVHRPAVAKAHLGLGRVHVHVHQLGRQVQVQHVSRLATVVEHVLIGLARGMGEQLVAHQAAVDVPVLQVRRGAREGRQRRPAGQAQLTGRKVEPQRGIHKGLPAQARQALFAGRQIQRRRQLLHRLAVVRPG
jgi:hypothetical protein